MGFERIFKVFLPVTLLICILIVCLFLIARQLYAYFLILIPAFIYQVKLINSHKRIVVEVQRFVDTIKNRDFSIRFSDDGVPAYLSDLYAKFNEINETFSQLKIERERQYLFFVKILEIIDIAILSYKADNGDVVWINESFKRILEIPYLKNISSLKKRYNTLYHEIVALKSKRTKVVTISSKQLTLLVTVNTLYIEEIPHKLICFQNINKTIDENEAYAWNKLLNVLTHEIMNSIAPISSLADTLSKMFETLDNCNSQTFHNREDIKLGIDTIKRRSDGLLRFTNEYRNFNNIPTPCFQNLFVGHLFENVKNLMISSFKEKGISFEVNLVDPNLKINADITLIEQVLINLLKNATEACNNVEKAMIKLSAEKNKNEETIIKVTDNGLGMSEELIDKIFIPFFSTRKKGGGVGLSLCKQIMLLHDGNIYVKSLLDKGSVFSISFPSLRKPVTLKGFDN